MNIINDNNLESIIKYFRSDKLFIAKNKNGSNLRKLIIALSREIERFENKLQEVWNGYDFLNDENMLDRWEKALGIPDDCIKLSDDNKKRGENIILKLSCLGASTASDFELIASLMGFEIEVLDGKTALTFPYEFPILFSKQDYKFTTVININSNYNSGFPYTFPIEFIEDESYRLKCLFKKLMPSNIVYRYI